jgi:hypothetical protein
LSKVDAENKDEKGCANALFGLDSRIKGGRIGQTSQKDFLFEPGVRGPRPKSLKLRGTPERGTILSPDGIERPALCAMPSTGWDGWSIEQTPGAVGSQEQDGTDPDATLQRSDCKAGYPTLFLAHTEGGLHFTMSDFEFPALPESGQDGFDGQMQLPNVIDPDGESHGAGQELSAGCFQRTCNSIGQFDAPQVVERIGLIEPIS